MTLLRGRLRHGDLFFPFPARAKPQAATVLFAAIENKRQGEYRLAFFLFLRYKSS
ncbi:MAG: hypothetical protein IJG56_03250 [Clostridia bacterium]|nr:hypothetical protein [Clostridia bacterium]